MLESLFNKAASLRSATLLKRDSNTGVLQNFLRTNFFIEHPGFPIGVKNMEGALQNLMGRGRLELICGEALGWA